MRGGEAVADSLHNIVHIGLRGIHGLHGARVLAPRERAQHDADLAEAPLQKVVPGMCEVPYCLVSGRVEPAHGGRAHVDHLGCEHGPRDVAEVVARYGDDAVARVGVAPELGEDLVPRDADGNGEPELGLHALRYLPRHEHGVAPEQRQGSRDVDPRLVEAEGLDEVCVAVVDHARQTRVALVGGVVGRHDDEVRALLLGLPDSLGRLHAAGLRLPGLREDDSVPALGVARHRHGLAPQPRVEVLGDARVEGVHVDMHDDPVAHGTSSLSNGNKCSILVNPYDAPDRLFSQSNRLWIFRSGKDGGPKRGFAQTHCDKLSQWR